MKRLTIRNFQAHKKFEVDFDPKITTIIGPSDVGKSAIIRALRWVMTNKPNGASFVRNGTKTCKVELEVEGRRIVRERGSKNLYSMEDQQYAAFGNEVPADIVEFLGVNELNFQSQHDAPYWFSSTAGEVGRELNQIVDLGLIDSSLSNINSMYRKAKAAKDVAVQRVDTAKDERRDLMYVKEMSKDFAEVETLKEEREEAGEVHRRLAELTGLVEAYRSEVKTGAARLSDAKEVLEKGEAVEDAQEAHLDLLDYIQSIEVLQDQAEQEVPNLYHLQSRLNSVIAKQSLREEFEDLVDKIETEERKQCQRKEDLIKAQESFQNEIGETCPLCNAAIK